jgi:hypothetical protein
VSRHFCSNCGSPIISEAAAPPGVSIIKAGTLDDTSGRQIPRRVKRGREIAARGQCMHGTLSPLIRQGQEKTTTEQFDLLRRLAYGDPREHHSLC